MPRTRKARNSLRTPGASTGCADRGVDQAFRRTAATNHADPPRPGPRPHRRRVRHRSRHLPSPATHRPRPRASEDRRAPRLGRRCDRRPALPRRPPPQRGGRPCAGPTLTSATATMSSSPSVARRPTRPEVERTCDVWSAAARPRFRSLHAAISPEPGDSVVGLGVDQINRRFAAACAAAGLEGQRTSHGCRVGLAVELTARGASHACHPTRRRLEEPRHWSFATPRPSARAKEPSAGPFKTLRAHIGGEVLLCADEPRRKAQARKHPSIEDCRDVKLRGGRNRG